MRAAAILASGLRTVFSRPETAQILDSLYPEKARYWQKCVSVLRRRQSPGRARRVPCFTSEQSG